MEPNLEDVLGENQDEDLDIDISDPSLIDKILYEDEEETPQKNPLSNSESTSSFRHQFTPDLPQDDSIDRKKLESLLKTESEHSSKVTQESIDPLDLIHNKELEEMRKTDKHQKKILEIKREYATAKLPLISVDEVTQISRKIAPSTGYSVGMPSAVTASERLILVGNTYGQLIMFSSEGQEIKSMKISRDEFGAVTSICISKDQNWAVSGFHQGQIVLWDLKSGSCIRASNSVHKSPVLSLEFWKESRSHLLSGDASGKVMLVEYGKSFLSVTLNSRKLLGEGEGACMCIDALPSSSGHPACAGTLAAIGKLDKVLVFVLEPREELLFEVKRPNIVSLGMVPCVQWNFGVTPKVEEPKDPLLALGWGNKVSLYEFKNALKNSAREVAFLEGEGEIKNLVWLSKEMIMTIGASREVKIVTTRGFAKQLGDDMSSAVLEDNFIVKDLAIQAYVRDEMGRERFTFQNSVKNVGRIAFLLGNKQFFKGRLLNWQECIDALTKKGNWLDALSLGLDLFQGKSQKMYGIGPGNQELKQVLERLVAMFVKEGALSWDYKISNAIEFCIGIQATDLLFEEFYDFFIDQGPKENMRFFMDTIEPYILNKEIKQLPTNLLGKMIGFYLNIGKPETIERLILSLDPTCIDPKQIIPHCKEHNLITAYIFINTNSTLQSFVNPLRLLRKTLLAQEEPKAQKFVAYKLLWYLRLCIRGQTFPSGRILEEYFPWAIANISNWLIKEDHLEMLIKIDATVTLKVMWEFFENVKAAEVFEKQASGAPSFGEFFAKLEEVCKGNSSAYHQLMLLIAKAASTKPALVSKELCIKTGKYLMKPQIQRRESVTIPNTSNIDSYIYMTSFADNSEYIPPIEYSLEEKGSLILGMIKSVSELEEFEVEDLFKIAVNSPYTEVLVYLQELLGQYKECVSTFIHCDSLETKKKVFDWLSEVFEKLEDEELEELKSEVMQWLNMLVDIDSDRTAKIVRDWFQNQHHDIIDKLDNAPLLQMKYLGELVKASSQDSLDENFIFKYVKLLCENCPQNVLEFLKSREDYSLDDCLDICKDYKVHDATAYLYERLGSTKEALDLLLDLVDKKQEELLQKMRKKVQLHPSAILELKPEIENALELCLRNTSRLDESENEEHWFSLLDNVLRLLNDFNEYFTYYPHLEPMLFKIIKQILEGMVYNVDFNRMITHIVSKFRGHNIKFKYFKDSIVGVLSRFSYQKNILSKAINLLNNDIRNMTQDLLLLRSKGVSSRDFKCASCGQVIISNDMLKSQDEKMLIFVCGHSYHGKCAKSRTCELCRKEEARRGNFALAAKGSEVRRSALK